MLGTNEKIQRIIDVSKMYYVKNMTQNEIAKSLSVSRPLISKILNDAIEMGIVTININYPTQYNVNLIENIREKYNLEQVYIIPQLSTSSNSETFIAEKAMEILTKEIEETKALGVGWGNTLELITEVIEKKTTKSKKIKGKIVPLIGGLNAPFKGYRPNELVKIMAEKSGLTPTYLFTPAFLASKEEKNIFLEMQNYKEVKEVWKEVDTAIVSIEGHPSVPDLATAARYGTDLIKHKAVGKVLSYYYNKEGEILKNEEDYAIQIPLEILGNCKKVIGIASSKTNKNAIIGALKSGLITHLMISNLTAEML